VSVASLTPDLSALPALPHRFLVLLAIAFLPVAAAAAEAAEPLPIPSGPVILTVTGNVGVTNNEGGASFDRQMLLDLGTTTISTSTPWTDGVQTFSGVLVRTVLERVDAQGSVVEATALNEYVVNIPFADFRDHNVLLAMEMNGEEMHVSDKGPIWIVYPWDDVPVLQNTLLHERWVWQLKALKVQ
jgi:hypothetical protein